MINNFFKKIFFLLIFPIVFLICQIKPLIHIKFCDLYTRRFGDFIDQVEGYLWHKKKDKSLSNCYIIFFWDFIISNKQLKKMTKRVMKVYPRFLFSGVYKALLFYKKYDHILYLDDLNFSPSLQLINMKTKPHLHFTQKELNKAKKIVNELGVPEEKDWICIHNRDSQYLEKTMPNDYPRNIGSWSYHNHRDFSVETLKESAEFFASKGLYVLRIGTHVREKLQSENKKVIDYANTKFRNDLMDVFLLSKCKFLLSGDAGVTVFPMVFNKPIFGLNISSTQIHDPRFCRYSLLIFKRLRNISTGKLLSIREILQSKFAYTTNAHTFKENGVEPVNNTSQEILLYSQEINKQINREKIENDEDLKIQKSFWSIYEKYVDKKKNNHIFPKISPSFLRNNLDLLN